VASSQDSRFLRRAADLAFRGRFRVEPNPAVGCVLVRRGRVVGEGYHAAWGAAHAEVAALRQAGAQARGATAYVTLEPCGHQGKTPPCAAALVEAGVTEVVYAHADPNPETAGEGLRILREAGVSVRKARTPPVVKALLRPYLEHLERSRPWVLAKWAMTLDGKIATRSGDARWVTSEETRRWSHRHLRAHADAILVGAGTLRADDPDLTNRSGRGRQPLRVVVCGRRPLPASARVLQDGRPLLVAAPAHFRAPAGAEVIACGAGGRVEIGRLLRMLFARGLRRILVEGGGDLLGSLFDRGLVDQVAVFVASRVVGGIAAVPAVGGRGRARMAEAWDLDPVVQHSIGPDHVVEGHVGRG
jgi:diaminohydroxyphosphoribosylaminopyrimidine deaminase/5-amino-6-(5-phosphoribosylamino)uracil reductase